MKVFHNQVFAGTGVDRHGDAITEEELQLLFDQISDPYVMYSEHNPGNRPFSKSFNKRLERLDTGELAIVCDVEIYDEAEMQKYGGYSVSFTRRTYTTNENREPELHIKYNPRLFDTDGIYRLVELSEDRKQLNASELYQKALDIPLIVFIAFVSGAVVGGFFNAMGEDLYGAVKKYLTSAGKKIREEHGEDLTCQFTFVATQLPKQPQVLVSVSSALVDRLVTLNINEEMILGELAKHSDLSDVARASIVLVDDVPSWRVEYVMDSKDQVPDTRDKGT